MSEKKVKKGVSSYFIMQKKGRNFKSRDKVELKNREKKISEVFVYQCLELYTVNATTD